MVAFSQPIVFFLTIPTNATTGARIVLDGTRGFVLVYDSGNNLIGSIAGNTGPIAGIAGTDSFGNLVFQGVTAYDPITNDIAVQMNFGQLVFDYINPAVDQTSYASGGIFVFGYPLSSMTLGSTLIVSSPSLGGGSGLARASQIFMNGTSRDNTAAPSVQITSTDSTFMACELEGFWEVLAEAWQSLAYAANWADGPFAPGKFKRNVTGEVKFSGMIQYTGGPTGAPVTVFTLPALYRPDRSMNLQLQDSPAATSNPATFSLQLGISGVASITNFAGTFTAGHLFSLEGIEFSLTQTP